jgi:S1-C subfamily serine protease
MSVSRTRMALLAVPTCLVASCSYSAATGGLAEGASITGYRYAVVAQGSSSGNDVMRELVNRGFRVLNIDGTRLREEYNVPARAVLLVNCAYLGHTSTDSFGSTGANVSCEAVDIATGSAVYSGVGKHTGLTMDADVSGAVRNALRAFPATGSQGAVTMVVDFPRRSGTPTPSSASVVRSGTGFYVTAEHVVTNAHVVEGCRSVTVSGQNAQVARLDRRNDLALLQAPRASYYLQLRTSRVLRSGEEIVVIGYPLHGLLASGPSTTTGVVSALAGIGDDTRFIQVTAPVQPGNSGGPLLDRHGSVAGVVVAKLDAARVFQMTGDIPQNVNFALSPSVLRGFLEAAGVAYSPNEEISELSILGVVERATPGVRLVECR